jgi:hypothetical protein
MSDITRTKLVCLDCGQTGARVDTDYDIGSGGRTDYEGFSTEAVPGARPWKDEAVRPVCKCGSRKIKEVN